MADRAFGAKKNSEIFEKDSSADLFLLPSKGGYPRQLTSLGDVYHGGVWSPESHRLCLVRSNSLEILHLDTGHIEPVYEGKIKVGSSELGDQHLRLPQWQPPDGRLLAFAVRESTGTILRVVSSDGTLRRDLLAVEGWITSWDWSPDGRRLIVITRRANGIDCDARLVDLDDNATLEALWTESYYQYCQPIAIWAHDSVHLICRSNNVGWAKLWIRRLDGKEAQPITQGSWDDYAFRISPDGSEIVHASAQEREGGGDNLWVSPAAGGPPRRLTLQPGENAPLYWSRDNRIYYWHSSPSELGDLWTVQADGGEPERLTGSTPVSLEHKLRPPLERLVQRQDGSTLPVLLYLPKDFDERHDQKLPGIVWIRGGPASNSYRYRQMNQWLANEGFVVAFPHYRGSIGSGVPYMNAVTDEGVGKNDLEDVITTASYLRGLPFVDTDRGLGIGGHSWGGYLSLMAVALHPLEFTCAVAGSAITDWRIQQAQTEVRHYDRWLLGGWVYEKPAIAKSRSPIEFVDRIRVPLFLYHGKADCDVPYAQCEAFLDEARRKGITIEEKRYEHEGHELANPENQRDCLNRISTFFRRHLQPWNFSDNPCSQQEE